MVLVAIRMAGAFSMAESSSSLAMADRKDHYGISVQQGTWIPWVVGLAVAQGRVVVQVLIPRGRRRGQDTVHHQSLTTSPDTNTLFPKEGKPRATSTDQINPTTTHPRDTAIQIKDMASQATGMDSQVMIMVHRVTDMATQVMGMVGRLHLLSRAVVTLLMDSRNGEEGMEILHIHTEYIAID